MTPNGAMTDRKSELLQRKQAREEKLRAEQEAHELEGLELEEKYCSQDNMVRGRDFEVIDLGDLGEGYVVMKLGEAVHHTRFQRSKIEEEANQYKYVAPNVLHPSPEAFKALFNRRPQILLRCANALAVLYGAKREENAGKF